MTRTLLAACAAISFVSAAEAQTDCSYFDRMLAAAPSGFSALRGEKLDDTTYAGRIAMPGAHLEDCDVSTLSKAGFAYYRCIRFYNSTAEAQSAWEAAVRQATACLPGRNPGTTSSSGPGAFEMVEGTAFKRPGDRMSELQMEWWKANIGGGPPHYISWSFTGNR